MKKFISYSFHIFLITLFLVFNIIYFPKAFSDINLVENAPNNNKLPNHFRMTTDITSLSEYNDLNLSGLDKLNISGSGQFSETGLDLIKNSLPNNFSIIDIDLRQESHGFINGIGISFENSKNNANNVLTLPEVISTEKGLLQSIKINTPLTFYDTKVTIVPDCVKDELTLTSNKNIGYIRIPVTDGSLPSDEMVDYFIDIVMNTPENTWYHFHCKEGIGRTTTFMIMYDIMRNHKEVSLNDIIKRQVLLSTIKEKDAQSFYTGKRFKFLSSFYNKITSKSTSLITFENLNSNDCYIKNPNITSENISDSWILLDKFKSSFN